MGGNVGLRGKTFEITSKDSVHHFTETVKVIADYVGQEYTPGGDIKYMIEDMRDLNLSTLMILQIMQINLILNLGKTVRPVLKEKRSIPR